MEETKRKTKAVIIDANVLIASLIKPSGRTSYVLYTLIDDNLPIYVPALLWEEIVRHKDTIIRKNKELSSIFKEVIGRAKRFIQTVDVTPSKDVLDLVNDEKDSIYVALALHLREKYPKVILLTYNKKDFKTQELAKRNILVLTPAEFITWLRKGTNTQL